MTAVWIFVMFFLSSQPNLAPGPGEIFYFATRTTCEKVRQWQLDLNLPQAGLDQEIAVSPCLEVTIARGEDTQLRPHLEDLPVR
jgi:hypothetical protein